MKSIIYSLCITLLSPLMIFQTPNVRGADGFEGSLIRLTVDFPVLGSTMIDVFESYVTDDVEFMPEGIAEFYSAVRVIVDVSDETILFDYDLTNNGRYAYGQFNGYVFTDLYDMVDDIVGVEIDDGVTTMDIGPDRISFNEDQIFLNLSSLSYYSDDVISLLVEFDQEEMAKPPQMPWLHLLL